MQVIKNFIYDLGITIYNNTAYLARQFSIRCGYPNNLGMLRVPEKDLEMSNFYATLESRPTVEETLGDLVPTNIWEVWFMIPKPNPPEKFFFEDTIDGYYNFYIDHFNNLTFLPDWISEFLQVGLGYQLDLEQLEQFRASLFFVVVAYMYLLTIRISLYWWLSINPYMPPFNYLLALTDWAEDALGGLIPTFFGVDMFMTFFMGFVGIFADQINNLVFTMPFLPSEGIIAHMPILGSNMDEKRDILLFHKLPYLWEKYGVPNYLRKYWYYERVDILNFMQKNYKDLGLNFLPDGIIEESKRGLFQLSQIDEFSFLDSSSTHVLAVHHFGKIYHSVELLINFINPI